MKKIRPEDLEIKIRKVGDAFSVKNVSPQMGETVEGDCESVDACDTNNGICMTRKYTNCSSCPETEKCYETWECQTLTCNDTKTSGEICCNKTHNANDCGGATLRNCVSAAFCPYTENWCSPQTKITCLYTECSCEFTDACINSETPDR